MQTQAIKHTHTKNLLDYLTKLYCALEMLLIN